MKKIYLSFFLFITFMSFSVQAASDAKLVGLWENSAVSLHLKADGFYDYKLNTLVSFSGQWSSDEKTITLNYKILGVKKNKLVRYTLAGKTLTIKKDDRPDVKLNRVK
jgi:lipopolysaccharide export system protein LptA